jgi:hypothetical protein
MCFRQLKRSAHARARQVNLIMDTMGALALGTEPPTDELLERKPYKRDASLIDRKMWRAIAVQATYQLALLLGLLYGGLTYLNLSFDWLERSNHLMFTCPEGVARPCTWRNVVRASGAPCTETRTRTLHLRARARRRRGPTGTPTRPP